MKISLTALVTVCCLCLAVADAYGAEEQKWCPLCSMNLKMFWKTNHWLTLTEGKKTGYCSIHCASKVYKKRPSEIEQWEVVDYDKKILVKAGKAHFLIGSDLPGTMTPVSKLAFSSLEDAKRHQKKHGGTIGSFNEALEKALAGFGADMALIRKKKKKVSAKGKELAATYGCYACHGNGGRSSKAVSWQSEQFIREMDSRVKIKKAILGGSHDMKGYEGKIPEKDLHAIAVYIWTLRPK